MLAGAGTGKTRTLVARAAWLREQGVQASRILLLTFTRRAADDMLARAAPAGRGRPRDRITGGTFHAIAHRIIRAHAESFSLPPDVHASSTRPTWRTCWTRCAPITAWSAPGGARRGPRSAPTSTPGA